MNCRLLAIALLFVVGCSKGKSGPTKADKAKLCADTSSQVLTAVGRKADTPTVEKVVTNMVLSCAIACDAGDTPSCNALEKDGFTYCGLVDYDVCQAACKELPSSASLNKSVCDFVK